MGSHGICALVSGAGRSAGLAPPGGYRCAVPGCTSRRNLHDHHLEFRSAGGSDAPGNRVTLCAFHHQRCLHAGLLRVTGSAPHGLHFELGLRSGGPPLVRYRSGDIAVALVGGYLMRTLPLDGVHWFRRGAAFEVPRAAGSTRPFRLVCGHEHGSRRGLGHPTH